MYASIILGKNTSLQVLSLLLLDLKSTQLGGKFSKFSITFTKTIKLPK